MQIFSCATAARSRALAAVPVLSIVALAATAAAGHAQVVLDNITTYSSSSTGDFAGGQFWDTVINNGAFDVFVIDSGNVNGTIINGGSSTRSLPTSLYPSGGALSGGTYTFTLLTQPGNYNPDGGLSLFFDGSTSANISAYNPFQNTASPTTTAPTATTTSNTIYNPFGGGNAAAGTLSYISTSGQTITLTSLEFFAPGVDRVGSSTVGASGGNDLGVQFTLNVTPLASAAPEPGSLALAAAGVLPILGLMRRRARRAA